ncbi:hypothetical protein MMC13_006726 [Lambiella insularis]|nr:hypothetical protein [Lambiella insularis]
MRLFLLPISTRRSLLYCQRLNVQLTSKQTYVEKITNRAGATWLKWEGADSGWQRKITVWGNELFKRIPYEEWGLKSIPPLSTRRAAEEIEAQEETEVVYPSSIIEPGTVFDVVSKLATERQALHRKQMWFSIAGMPITAPFGLIPVLPNIPFFYLVWRAWSHWRALGGSRHVDYLLQKGLIKSAPSEQLSRLYAKRKVSSEVQRLITDIGKVLEQMKEASFLPIKEPTLAFLRSLPSRIQQLRLDLEGLEKDQLHTQRDVKSENAEEQMVLWNGSGRFFAHLLQVRELDIEIERAIEQVQKSLRAKVELHEEKEKLAAATKATSTGGGAKD